MVWPIVVLKVAVIALGSIGRRHVRTLGAVFPTVEILAVRSRRSPRHSEEDLVAKVLDSKDDAIRDGVDGAIICSPASQHVSDARAFLEHNIAVLIEKPLSDNLIRAKELRNQASDKEKILLGYTFRYAAGFDYLQKLISADRLGKIVKARFVSKSYLPDWRPHQDYRTGVSASKELGGGVLLELSHEIDMALSMLGPFDSVRAEVGNTGTLQILVEDYAKLSLSSARGVDVTVDLDFSSEVSSRFIEIEGESGRVVWDLLENSVAVHGASNGTSQLQFADQRDDFFARQLNHFFQLIGQETTTPSVGLDEGIAVLEVIEAARQSARLGCEVLL